MVDYFNDHMWKKYFIILTLQVSLNTPAYSTRFFQNWQFSILVLAILGVY